MKILVTILLFLSLSGFTQEIGVWVDPMNAITGSSVNSKALNWKVSIMDDWNYDIPFWFGMEYEAFNRLGYQQWVFAKFAYLIPITRTIEIFPGFGLSQIYHETSYSNDAMAYMFNLELNIRVIDNFLASIQLQRQRSTDIDQLWRDSIYIGIKYRIK